MYSIRLVSSVSTSTWLVARTLVVFDMLTENLFVNPCRYPILAVVALLFIVCIVLFFWCKGKKKKRIARINESATSDVVSFQRFADDEYRVNIQGIRSRCL